MTPWSVFTAPVTLVILEGYDAASERRFLSVDIRRIVLCGKDDAWGHFRTLVPSTNRYISVGRITDWQ